MDQQPTPEIRSLAMSLLPYRDSESVAAASRLRRDHDAGTVAAALTQARLITRAEQRFGHIAELLWWTADGLEQASRPELAAHHAARLRARGVKRVADLCCSIGLDAIAFAQAGLEVVAYDIDADALRFARANSDALGVGDAIDFRLADVTGLSDFDGTDAVFIDPARRAGGSRTLRPETWSPPWSWISGLGQRAPLVLAKVAPGIPHDALPTGAQTEWVSWGGGLLEAAPMWGAGLQQDGLHRAVLLDRGLAREGNQDVSARMTAEVGPVAEYLHEPEAAAIRAGLVAEVADDIGGHLLDPHIAYIATDRTSTTDWAVRYRVVEEIPFGLKGMRARLQALGFGNAIIKKRGVNVEPDVLRKQLRLSGSGPTATIILTRREKPLALLVERV